ncbi:hypothetical protein IFM89_000485, partial [Coptis chinensis]
VKRFERILMVESAGKWVKGTSTLPKVFDQPNGSKLELDKWELDETGRSPLWLDFEGTNSETKRVNGKGTFIPAMPHMKNIISHRRSNYRNGSGFNLWSFGILRSIKQFLNVRANRAKQIAKHLLWKNKFSRFEEIMSRGNLEHPPSLGDLFCEDSHKFTKRDGALDDQSREYIGSDASRRHGRVRLKGRGVTPTKATLAPTILDNRVNDRKAGWLKCKE